MNAPRRAPPPVEPWPDLPEVTADAYAIRDRYGRMLDPAAPETFATLVRQLSGRPPPPSKVTPIRTKRGATFIGFQVQPAKVRALMSEAMDKASLGRRARKAVHLPAPAACLPAANLLSSWAVDRNVDPAEVYPGLGGAGPDMVSGITKLPIEWWEKAGRGNPHAEEVRRHIRNVRDSSAWLIANVLSPPPEPDWKVRAAALAEMALAAWATAGEAPRAAHADRPLAIFVQLALAEIGVAMAAETISAAIKRARARR